MYYLKMHVGMADGCDEFHVWRLAGIGRGDFDVEFPESGWERK